MSMEEERAKEQEELDAAQKRKARLREEIARAIPATIPQVSEHRSQFSWQSSHV